MTKKNGVTYDPVKNEVHISQLIRRHPTVDKIVPYQRRQIDDYVERYIDFLNRIRIAPDAVKQVLEMAKESKFYKGRNFHIINDDKTAFALVKYGKKPINEGLRIIYSHCDSPCLQLKVKPLNFEWDIDLRDMHLGVELDTIPYGGVHAHQWAGRRLHLTGWTVIKGRRRNINLPVYSAEISPHADTRREEDTGFSEAHKQESLDLISGHKSRKELIKEIGFTGEEDFARTRLYAVPIVKAEKLHKFFITGYGHDNRIGVFTSVEALFKSNPKYTTIVIGFDKEEVGSSGSGGAKSRFFEEVINEILTRNTRKPENITQIVREEIYRNSIAVNADVDIGSTDKEIDNIDVRNTAKLGYGMFVAGTDGIMESDQQSPKLVDRIMSVLERRRVIFQTIGSPVPADKTESVATMNEFFINRGIPTINCSASVGSLHSPEEIVHIGDIYYTIKGYQAIIEDPRYVVRRKRRRKKK